MALVSYELADDIAVLTLSRPEKRNAMSDAMLTDLAVAVDRAAREAKAAVLRGEGKHFCAGLDLAEHVEKTVMQGIAGSREWHAVFTRIQRGAIPYFVALHGAVVGGGLELAAAAHVRVADANTYFALPEGQRGIFVGGGGSVNVSRLMGVSRMMDLMLTGRVLSADEAERYGIVNYLAEPGGTFEKAMELARIAARNAPLSNYAIINALQRIHDSGYDEGLFFESMIASLTQVTPEAHERLRAFLEKKAARLAIPEAES
ncbi:crotonase/enoyl-CoA hydratase family protein [Chelativorans sp.]|uniref:crotonase/enoyl-CoA hydratase family protein n=1 Tax=Chelativorans sp. TaxID=2203393 RepID=UPI002810B4A4|nr:crotonase/enoyl-CoA hydratase family protein [Chelativorans sp.]